MKAPKSASSNTPVSRMPKIADDKVARWSDENVEQLFREYAKTKDPAIREKLVMIHQNLVRYLASKFANRGESLEDLVQVGLIGLVNAVDRFDPSRGTKFSTFATPTIVGEIRRHFRDNAWSLKVPRRLQELNAAASKASEKLGQRLVRPPSVQDIANEIGATEEETLAALELGNAYETVSLDSKLSNEDDAGQQTLAEFLGETDSGIEDIETLSDLTQAMERLEPRERAIIYYRFFRDMPQTEVAKKLNISQMHVSRLQQKALKRLKEILSS